MIGQIIANIRVWSLDPYEKDKYLPFYADDHGLD